MPEQTWILYAFADYLDHPNNLTNLTATLPDPYRKWELGGGVNWLPTSFTRYRLGFTVAEYVGDTAVIAASDRDYWSLDLSAGVAF